MAQEVNWTLVRMHNRYVAALLHKQQMEAALKSKRHDLTIWLDKDVISISNKKPRGLTAFYRSELAKANKEMQKEIKNLRKNGIVVDGKTETITRLSSPN